MLNSKLLTPNQSNIYTRPRTAALFNAMAAKRLSLVVAGAGYGKTTLVAGMLKQRKPMAVWYSLDERDQEFLTFIRYVAQGFKAYLSDEDRVLTIPSPHTALSKRARFAILEELIRQLAASVTTEIFFVLDDFYLVHERREIREAVEFMLKHLPASVHMVIITREEPKIRTSGLRVMNQVADIGEVDLTFTRREIGAFYSKVLDLDLPPGSLAQLHARTNGWVAGLILFYLSARGKSCEEIDAVVNGLQGSNNFIFRYLEENIFDSQPRKIKAFMLKTAPLESLEPDFCNTYLGIDDSAKLLARIADSHLLIFEKVPGRLYCYHQLLREYLLEKLSLQFDGKNIRHLYLNIARLFEEKGDEVSAISYYIEGRHFSMAVRRMFQIEEKWFHDGCIFQLRSFMARLPAKMIRTTPELIYIQAKICSFSGEYHRAISLFDAALQGFLDNNSGLHALECRMQLGLHYYYTGNIRKAEASLLNCINTGSDEKYAAIAGLLILIYAILGDMAKADAYANRAIRRLAAFDGFRGRELENWIRFIHSYRYVVSGDFKRAHAMACGALDEYRRRNLKLILPLACLHVALPAYFLNQCEHGCNAAREGLSLLGQLDIRDNQAAWLNYALALNLNGLGRLDEAVVHAGKSLGLFQQQSNYWGLATVYDLLHFICLKREDIPAAEENLSKAAVVLKKTDLPLTRAIIDIGRINILVGRQQLHGIGKRLAAVEKAVSPSKFYTTKACLLFSMYYLSRKKKRKSLEYLTKALGMADACGYAHHLARQGDWMEPLLLELYAKNILKACIRQIFNFKGPKGRHALMEYQKATCAAVAAAAGEILKQLPAPTVPGLKISLLGKFKLLVGEQERRLAALGNSKAAMLIKYLAYNHDNGFIHRDQLIELLWPEEDFNKTRKRFNVAVSAVRKFFDPDIKRIHPSLYLQKQGVAFRLDLGDMGRVDVDDFMDEISSGDRADDRARTVAHYLNAEKLYGGPFLMEDTYTPWCCDVRRHLQSIYLTLLEKIISYLLDEKDHVAGIIFCDKYLSVDDSTEQIYRKLMHFYAMAGEPVKVKKTFEACKQNVSVALDCPLQPKTIDLYHRLLRYDV